MIIYGIKGKQLKRTLSITRECSQCYNSKHTVTGAIKYFYLFRIPLMVMTKRIFIRCDHCKKIVDYDLLSEKDQPEFPKQLFSIGQVGLYYAWFWIIAIVWIVSSL